ncbi:MAG: GTP cyclohydrolase I FolE2 [Verrucomicrobiae bacterium]|nr:GTP cyclohydrolase I FolE2 [Verrucomicrobiae bacterium]
MRDTQSQKDSRGVPIEKVGVKSLRYPIVVADLANRTQQTVAVVNMYVDLPHQFKGTHMSRFVEILRDHGRAIHVENIAEIVGEMSERLNAEQAHLEITFPYFMEKKAPVTGSPGLVDYEGFFHANLRGRELDFAYGVVVPVTTLCPCSKAISARGAHNQRGVVRVEVRTRRTVWLEELIQCVEKSSSSELYSLLKRQDEKFVTERAFDHPVFVEDLVRAVAVKLRADPRIAWYRVEAENFESIHNHNAYAQVTGATPAPRRAGNHARVDDGPPGPGKPRKKSLRRGRGKGKRTRF